MTKDEMKAVTVLMRSVLKNDDWADILKNRSVWMEALEAGSESMNPVVLELAESVDDFLVSIAPIG